MNKPMRQWTAVGLMLMTGISYGADAPAEAPPPETRNEIGVVSRQWLALQRNGTQASKNPQNLSGQVQEQVYERYRKSFTHPIPERLSSGSIREESAAK